VPSDVGVRISLERLAAEFDHAGFVKRDDGWYSANWDRVAHHLTVSAQTLIGKVDVQQAAR
jgi:hypothetical protein